MKATSPNAPTAPIIVFADLNCPFCYALSETLDKQNLMMHTYWMLIEHAPATTTPWTPAGPVLHQTLRSEVETVQSRCPGLQVCVPTGQPNTSLPILAVADAYRRSVKVGLDLKLRLQRALFIDNQDIGSKYVVNRVRGMLGLGPLELSPELRPISEEWQKRWAAVPKKMIPTMLTRDGVYRYGLGDPDDAANFVRANIAK